MIDKSETQSKFLILKYNLNKLIFNTVMNFTRCARSMNSMINILS